MKYEPPYSLYQIKADYPEEVYLKLADDPVHRWRAETGVELVHNEPTDEELERIWRNWQLMPASMKNISDEKSYQLFGVSNADHYKALKLMRRAFNDVVSMYKEKLGVDLSYMHFRTGKLPLRIDGSICYDLKPEECGGDWTSKQFIRLNPDILSVKRHYGIESMSDYEFELHIIAHELAHEIWNNIASQKDKDYVVSLAHDKSFSTQYLDSLSKDMPQSKRDQETFCEMLSDRLVFFILMQQVPFNEH